MNKREIVVIKTNERWWNFPWQAWLEINGNRIGRTFEVGSTRWGVLRKTRRNIREYEKEKPRWSEVSRENLPA